MENVFLELSEEFLEFSETLAALEQVCPSFLAFQG